MKIGLVSWWLDMFGLFPFLSKYDHEYVVYYDSLHAPYYEKNFTTSLSWVEAGIAWLKKQGVEKIILAPMYELSLLQKYSGLIIPLFKEYLLKQVASYSLVGKIWLLGAFGELQVAQDVISEVFSSYQPIAPQKATKVFSFPFHFWTKDVGTLTPLFSKLSWKSFLVASVLKHELRYFKDVRVDTVIPLNYSYFFVQTTIKKFFNFKKIRFHPAQSLESLFLNLVPSSLASKYQVSIFATDQAQTLLEQKRLIWMLQRGKQFPIHWISKD